MTEWQKKYRWVRTTFGDELPTEREIQDYCGYVGEEYIGRIFLETAGPTKGLWRWAGSRPNGFKDYPIMPNAGYQPIAAEAAMAVESYWDEMKARIEKSPPNPKAERGE